MKKNYPFDQMLIIGIDPGTNTGYALFKYTTANDTIELIGCDSYDITEVIEQLMLPIASGDKKDFKILVEDARERKWFGTAESRIYQKIKSRQPVNASELSTYKGMLLGAGSVRRDCSILEEFLKRYGYSYHMIPPKNSSTKVPAAAFKKLTGWNGRTNEHSRDAAMLVLSNYKKYLRAK